MIELRPLRQFVAVAEELHFGRAARRLHMTQPPLTQAIRGLEATLQVVLFERTRRSVALTPAGAVLLEQARRLLKAADELPRLVHAAAEGLSGRLRLAFVSSIAYGPLPEWLRGFREAHPDVSLQLREATLDVQLQAFDACMRRARRCRDSPAGSCCVSRWCWPCLPATRRWRAARCAWPMRCTMRW